MDREAERSGKAVGNQAAPCVAALNDFVGALLAFFADAGAALAFVDHDAIFEEETLDAVEQGLLIFVGVETFADCLVGFGVVAAERFAHLRDGVGFVVEILHVEGVERGEILLKDDFIDLLAVVDDIFVGYTYKVAEDETVRTDGDASAGFVDLSDFGAEIVQEFETEFFGEVWSCAENLFRIWGFCGKSRKNEVDGQVGADEAADQCEMRGEAVFAEIA